MKKGERVHLHNGTVHTMKRDGLVPGARRRRRGPGEILPSIRGFIRGALVDAVTGEEALGDWHENYITSYGHQAIVRNFIGLHATATSSRAAAMTDMLLANWWAIGSLASTGASSSVWTSKSALDAELGTASTGAAGGTVRAVVSTAPGFQALSGTWSLTQTYQYVSSALLSSSSINAIAQYGKSGADTALSFATFDASTKGTNQNLNISYTFQFST